LGIPAQAIGKNLTRLIIAFGAPAVLLHSFHTQHDDMDSSFHPVSNTHHI
jgi:hypothetical protein